MSASRLKTIYLALVSAILFLIPSNLFLKFFVSHAYVSGILVDYLIPKLYLSDFFVMGVIGLWLYTERPWKKWRVPAPILFLGIILFIRQFFTPYPLAAVWYSIKLIELTLFALFLFSHRELLKIKIITVAILTAIIFQSVLGIYQFHFQRSLAGYWFLGEPQLSTPYGLAKLTINGVEKIEPYGTTAHPNILAGILCVYTLAIIARDKKNKHTRSLQLIKVIAIITGVTAIILAGSVSAWIALAIGTLLLVSPKKISTEKILIFAAIISVATPLVLNLLHTKFSTPSITRRVALQSKAVSIFLDHPLVGIGLNQFTGIAEHYGWDKEVVRFDQPVHHIGLLWLAETGLLGVIFIYLVGEKVPWKKITLPLAILVSLASLDHYLLTQQSGLLLGIFTLSYFAV